MSPRAMVPVAAVEPSLGRQVRLGAMWSGANTIVLRLGTFVVGVAAARLLAPDQFGVFAVALTVHMIIINMSDLGVSAYVVRYQGDLRRVAPTVVTMAMASTTVLAALMAFGAPGLARLLGSPEAEGSIRVLAITVLLAGPSAVPNSLLVRDFQQKKRFMAECASFLASTGVLLILASSGAGALSLAWSRVTGQLVLTGLYVCMVTPRYAPGWDRGQVPAVLRFGGPLVAASFLGFIIGNVDYIMISHALGNEALGLYYLAHNVASWPYSILSPVIGSVALAAFARISSDRASIPGYLTTTLSGVMAVALPASALLAALAVPLVAGIYGDRWAGAAGALAVTALYGVLRIPADILSNLLIALGRTRSMLAGQALYGAVLIPLTYVGVLKFGIVGAGLAHGVGIAFVLLPWYAWSLQLGVGVHRLRLVSAIAPPAVAAIIAAALAFSMTRLELGPWATLVTAGGVGAAAYVALLGSWLRKTLPKIRETWAGPERSRPLTPQVSP